MAGQRDFEELARKIRADPKLEARFKANPAEALEESRPNQIPDTFVYRVVVSSLGLAVLIALIGTFVLVGWKDATAPDLATAIGSAAVGALAGLLAPSPVSG